MSEELVQEPIHLGDFIYAYASGLGVKGDLDMQVRAGVRAVRELREHAITNLWLEGVLHRAFTVRAERDKRRQAQQPLSLFPDWAQSYSSYARAWHTHQSGEQLLQVFERLQVDHKLLVRAGCDCARIALLHVPEGENRPRIAIETTEAWCDGRATIEQVRVAARGATPADAANAAAYAAYAANAATAANAAAYAANAAAYAAYAATADAAANAAAYAANAARAAYSGAARVASAAWDKTQAHCADPVRARIPWSVVRDAIREQQSRRLP